MYKVALLVIITLLFAGCGSDDSSRSTTTTTASSNTALQMQIVSIGEEEVVLNWDYVKEATHYQLYWSDSKDKSYYESVYVEGITYTHQVDSDKIYNYYVIAMNEDEEISLPSEVLAVKVVGRQLNQPSDTI